MPPSRAGFAPWGRRPGRTDDETPNRTRFVAPGAAPPGTHLAPLPAHARYARPSAIPASRTTSATTHATPHCMAMTAHIIFVPSSFLTAETAATHGV